MFPADRNQLRAFYFKAWRKWCKRQPLEPLEALVAEVVQEHPEYHAAVEAAAAGRSDDASTDVPGDGPSPFLHMGMHVALREQHGADRPPGVRDVYERLVRAQGDRHQAEHAMMDCLGEAMWTAQRTGTEADLNGYLGCLRRQLPGGALFSR